MARRRVLPDLVARLRLDASGFDNRLKRVERSLKDTRTSATQTDDSLRRMGGTARGTGTAFATLSTRVGGLRAGLVGLGAAGAVLAGGGGIAALLRGSVTAASDLNETVSKSQQVFGASQQAVANFAQTAANSIGQSRQAALDAAASFGNLFAGMGIGEKQAADFSIQLTRLASDFASFANADPAEAANSIRSAFVGEFDPLQKFIPAARMAAVQQKALEMGLAKTTAEITAQDQALATYQFIIDNAGAATGDFARTSDGLANQQRILAANVSNAKEQIGQNLLPTINTFVKFLNEEGIAAVRDFAQSIADWGRSVAEDVKPVLAALDAIRDRITAIDQAGGGPGRNPAQSIRDKVRAVFGKDPYGAEPVTTSGVAGPGRDSITARLDDLTKARNTLGTSTAELIRRQQVLTSATARTTEQDEKAANAADRLKSAQNALAAAHRRVADAAFDVLDAEDDLREAQFRQGVGSEEAIKAQRALERARLNEVDARADVGDRLDAVAKANRAIAEALPSSVDKFGGYVKQFDESVRAWLGAGTAGAVGANQADTRNMLAGTSGARVVVNTTGDVSNIIGAINRELDWSARTRAGRGGRARV